ncbi:ATP-binding protein [Nocardioides jishulii]|uniref:PspC domain-containing protein n=1 Tax=Nocardioides jishulii TaxID=2575440 RepID=A0A4U2YX70_9ACTN|nr:ATP-binding protein [Nocardioides jishulii]QCX28336.1 PspC domain-containing protein [Nocardioides jishulii]TKI64771.1 PspC domain-containing protein [Nocardioides jishulii]
MNAPDPAAPTAHAHATEQPLAAPQWRRATRNSTDPLVGGVASGLAEHLGLPVLWIRLGFLAATALSGLGTVLYAALWLFLPTDARFEESAPGLESATRTGKRPGLGHRLGDMGQALALGVLGIGLVLMVETVLGRGAIVFPVLIAGVGVALLWRQADEAQRERWLDSSGRVDPFRAIFGAGTTASYVRLAAGAGLVVVATALFAVTGGRVEVARDVWLATLLGIAGLAVVVGPWVVRLASDLGAERAERIRTQERADMAAHLHDSVLQTLALIQRNASDPTLVARLARGQERELRAWLYTGEAADAATVAGALREVAGRVEDEHAVVVDLVTVGDRAMDESMRPLVQATREAMVNSAKHAGTARVDVFAETTEHGVEVFVRDRGVGFDPGSVGEDRHGVRHSIINRMTRHGGTAQVRSAPGEGTEVRLSMPVGEEA